MSKNCVGLHVRRFASARKRNRDQEGRGQGQVRPVCPVFAAYIYTQTRSGRVIIQQCAKPHVRAALFLNKYITLHPREERQERTVARHHFDSGAPVDRVHGARPRGLGGGALVEALVVAGSS